MWPDRVSSPGSLAFETDELMTALCDPALFYGNIYFSLKGAKRCLSCWKALIRSDETICNFSFKKRLRKKNTLTF